MKNLRVLLILPMLCLAPFLDAALPEPRNLSPILLGRPILLSSPQLPALAAVGSNRSIIVAYGNSLAVVWAALDQPPGGTFRLYVRVSGDTGKTWSPSVQLDKMLEGPGWGSYAPAVVFENDRTIAVSWLSYRLSDRYRLLFARSTDGGNSWKTSTVDQGFAILAPQLALFPEGLVLLWQRTKVRDGNSELFFARSSDHGETWQPQLVSNYVTSEAFLLRSPKGKLTIVSSGGTAKGGNLPVVIESTDGGTTWNGPMLPSDVDDIFFSLGSVVVDRQERLHLVWSWYLESSAIYYDHSSDGKHWNEDEILYSLPKGSLFPRLFLDPATDVLYCGWTQKSGEESDLYLKRRVNSSWVPDDESVAVRIDQVFPGEKNGASVSLSLHFLRKKVIALWQDSKPGVPRILLNYSVDGAKSWSRRESILDHVPAKNKKNLYAAFPAAIDDGKDTLYLLYYMIDPIDPRQPDLLRGGDLYFRKVRIR